MRSIVFAVLAACSLIGTSARTISGIITDENNQPLEFVNVVLLCDSSFIDGKVTDAAGAFEFVNADSTANMLKMSIIGYENIAMQIPADGRCGTLHLTPSAVMLNEVVVNHNYPGHSSKTMLLSQKSKTASLPPPDRPTMCWHIYLW